MVTPETSKETSKKTPVILVVDDEEDLCEILAEDLCDEGFETVVASSGNEAFEVIQDRKIDLVLTDINMPNGNGVELLKEVKDRDPELPVVLFMTAYADLTVEQAYDQGAEAIFSKPVDVEILKDVIRSILTPRNERWSRAHERFETKLTIEVSFQSFESVQGTALNIGRGGIFLALEQEELPKEKDSVAFEIRFQGGEWREIKGKGVVRWVRHHSDKDLPKGVGVEFVELDAPSVTRVVNLLNAVKTRSYIPQR